MEMQQVFIEDSLKRIESNLISDIDSLNGELTIYKYKSETLQDVNRSLKESNSNLSRSNRNLSETNKSLINKDNKE